MCGILAIFSNGNVNINEDEIQLGISNLSHRGKDNISVKKIDHNYLAHCRLSIIDLSNNANQPIENESSDIFLICNGEIYNYKELKKELISKGHNFKSNSDNEVIIHGYEEFGFKILDYLIGMFAFVIYDKKNNIILAARDRFGIKPIYYTYQNNTLILSSEIKGLLNFRFVKKTISLKSICSYLTYRYIPSPDTIFENIYKLEPATYLVFKENKISTIKYWELQEKNINITKYEFEELFYSELEKSFLIHTISDVNFGLFLSSGYDSSFLAYLAYKYNYSLDTFTIGFDNWIRSEEKVSQLTAKIFNHKNYYKTIKIIEYDLLEKIIYYFDEPIADISIIPTFLVSQLASEKHKVVISGDGADELLVGYNWTRQLYNNYCIKLLNKTYPNIIPYYYAKKLAMGLFDKKELKKIISSKYHNAIYDPFYFYKKNFRTDLHLLKAIQYLDIKTFCSELVLTKVDRCSMANTLEVRVPFLNHKLFELVFSVPVNYYFNKKQHKILLYNKLKKHITARILKRPKLGFVGPDELYKNYNLYKNYLSKSMLVKDGIINDKTLNEYLINSDHWRLWKILLLELWYRKWGT